MRQRLVRAHSRPLCLGDPVFSMLDERMVFVTLASETDASLPSQPPQIITYACTLQYAPDPELVQKCQRVCSVLRIHEDVARICTDAVRGHFTALNKRLYFGNPLFRSEFTRACDAIVVHVPVFRQFELWIVYNMDFGDGVVVDAIVLAPTRLPCTTTTNPEIIAMGESLSALPARYALHRTHVWWTYRQYLERIVQARCHPQRGTAPPKKIKRGDACPCGTGIKYKKCCGVWLHE